MKWLIPALSGLVFLLTGLALIPLAGLQNDELFFSGPIYAADAAFFRVDTGPLRIPLMVMSYTGALKTWLYAGFFRFIAPTVWSVRLPVLLAGVLTIWLTWVWVRQIAPGHAAAVTAVLLGTDTIFLLTNTFDWGPVALQHVLLMGGLVCVQRWIGNTSNRVLALGFFLWGLGMWDKALMAWPLIGLALALFLVFPREAASRVRVLPAFVALASFLLGAAPLVWYNIERSGETVIQNAKFTTSELTQKINILRQTIDGSNIFGYMVYADAVPGKRQARTRSERFAVWLSRVAGNHQTNWMLPAWTLGFVFSLFVWIIPGKPSVRRPLLFLLVVAAAGWVQMAVTRGAGASAHHVILLWPFPAVFLGIAFSAMADRIPRVGAPVLALVTLFLAGENLLTTNEYVARFAVNGASGGWTDAIFHLSDTIDNKSAPWLGLVDWGYLNALRMLHNGDLQLFIVDVNADRKELEREIGSPEYLFIQHTEDKQIFPGINDRLRKAAGELGYVERPDRTVADRNGRPVFELFRFQKQK